MPTFDILLRNCTIYNGTARPPVKADLALLGDRIAEIGRLSSLAARRVIDVNGLAVAPGFINMLSWACQSLIADGRSQSDIRQGVTLEVMGEGFSYGPFTDTLRQELIDQQGDIKFDVPWTTLDEYLEHLVGRGVTPNVASFVGAGTLRAYVMGYNARPASSDELAQMQALAARALEDGAVGVSTALAYVPDSFFSTNDLVALAQVAAQYDRLFIAHMRGDGDRLLEGIDEMIEIAQRSGARVEIYHLKVAGWRNWSKLPAAIERIEAARAAGLEISADIYPYAAASSGLDLCMPAWVQEGGHAAWVSRLKNPDVRERLLKEMAGPGIGWENALDEVVSPEGILFTGFKNPALKAFTGKTLGEVANLRGASPAETVIDLVIEDDSRVSTVFFTMDEVNLRDLIRLPWISLCSDAASLAPEGVFLQSNVHPRAYGSFARFLGQYAREESLLSLDQAVHRLTGLPASNLKLRERGVIHPGYFADVVVFDPETVWDHATFTEPHQYAAGVQHVLVNGILVIENGEHTGRTPGRVVRGSGPER